MGTLYLVRHGQASLGDADYDKLSLLGYQQSVRLGEYFAAKGVTFDVVIAGTLRRHGETLDGMARGMGVSLRSLPWPGLNEYDSDAVIAAVHPGPMVKPNSPEGVRQHFRLLRAGLQQWMDGATRPEGMPPYSEFADGVTRVLDHMRAQYHGRTVLVVSSGGPISVAVSHVLGAPNQATIDLNMRIRNSSVTELTFTSKRHTLLTYNTLPHLDDARYKSWMTYA